MEKKSFILHLDSLDILEKMDDIQRGKFIYAIYQYQKTGILPELDFGLDMAVTPFINQFKRDGNKYQSIVERNKNNGSKGGRPKNPNQPKETQITQSVFEKPKKADNDNDNENENDFNKKKLSIEDQTNQHNQYFQNIWKQKMWVESICIQNKKNTDDLKFHLNKFRLECIAKEDFKESEKDAKNHFVNWMKKGNPIETQYLKGNDPNNWW